MQLSESQRASRARFRQYLAESYGRDVSALMMNIAELESNFSADATNNRTSASGITQITAPHWDTLTRDIRNRISRGQMSTADLPSGMTVENLGDFNLHKFDEISGAFMTRQNIDFLGRQFVNRANKQRALNGKPQVPTMAELTGGNYALEAFMIAGGHKDGWGVHTSGKLEGTGFGVAIQNGDIDLDALFSSYSQNRERNERAGVEITDGMGHGLTYSMYASDNVMESAGGPKLQLRPDQIQTGLRLKAPNVRVNHRITAPWIDRGQQIDPGFEPDDANLDQWLQRLNFADPDAVAGANDIVSTNAITDFGNENLPRVQQPAPVALPESRNISEDPSVAARSERRLAGRIARTAEQALGASLEFLIPEAQAAETNTPSGVSATAAASTDPLASASTPRTRRNPLTNQTVVDQDNSVTDRLFPDSQGSQPRDINPITGQQLPQGNPITGQGGNPSLDTGEFGGTPIETGPPTIASTASTLSPDQVNPNFDDAALAPGQLEAERLRLQNIVDDFNLREIAQSAEIEGNVAARAAELQQNAQQDLAISLSPNITLAQQDLQPLATPTFASLLNPATPDQAVGNVTPSAAQTQDIVDLSRLDNSDFERAAAGQLIQEDQFGSINDFINRERGTDFVRQSDNLQLDAARLGLQAFADGSITTADLPRLRDLTAPRDELSRQLSRGIINSSRGN